MGKDNKDSDKHKKRKHDHEDEEEREKRKSGKKAAKVAKLLGYSNDINPFGDSNLLQPFVWGKKKDKDKKEGREEDESEEKRFALMKEIERVRNRRDEREKELEEMDRLRTEEQRLRESALYGDWQQKDEDFYLEQTKVRSKIRLVEKREQPIDILAKNILQIESCMSTEQDEKEISAKLINLDVEIRDPVSLVKDVQPEELPQLVEDVDSYLQLEVRRNGPYVSFWTALKEIIAAERRRVMSKGSSGLHKSVLADIEKLFDGKSSKELKEMADDIMKSLRDGRRSDVEYWESMATEVRLESSRVYLKEIHQELLLKQLQLLQNLKADEFSSSSSNRRRHDKDGKEYDDEETVDGGDGKTRVGGKEKDYRFVKLGSERPTPTATRTPTNKDSISLDATSMSEEAWYRAEEGRGLDEEEGEEKMENRDEVQLPGSVYWWQDKYRPRKPRYFNRVKTGYDWNKYNQTHYDHDNPPPKTVQGYKFNVFYPDLIDKTKTPKYFLEAADDPDFCILRFHVGPPYEDLAFKIVNREWEIGRRAGFKCLFERGVLQLHFNFKRHRYRR